MIGLHAQHRYYLYAKPADMRKSFDGLGGLVRNHTHRIAIRWKGKCTCS